MDNISSRYRLPSMMYAADIFCTRWYQHPLSSALDDVRSLDPGPLSWVMSAATMHSLFPTDVSSPNSLALDDVCKSYYLPWTMYAAAMLFLGYVSSHYQGPLSWIVVATILCLRSCQKP